MDLKLLEAEPSAAERAAIDAVVGPGGGDGRAERRGHASRARRRLLLPALRAAQRRVGWISEGALGHVCRRLDVPPADAYGVASFYALLSLEPRPERVLHVCDDIACRLVGVPEVEGEHVIPSPCLGLCDRAPAALLTVAGERPEEAQLAP
jgi:NADH-quinone oxidoreductase subunit F